MGKQPHRIGLQMHKVCELGWVSAARSALVQEQLAQKFPWDGEIFLPGLEGPSSCALGAFRHIRAFPIPVSRTSYGYTETQQPYILGAMKICIQHNGTRKFLRGVDTWTDSCEGARQFATSIEAFRHCVEHKLGGVNIIVERGAARPPIVIPVEIPPCTGKPATGFPQLVAE